MFHIVFSKLLQERNLSVSSVAKGTGIAQSTLSEYKNGIKKPTGEKVAVIAKHLGVTTDYLLGNSDESTEKEKSIVDAYNALSPEKKWIYDAIKSLPEREAALIKGHIELLVQSHDE